jgi:hypothetical protein
MRSTANSHKNVLLATPSNDQENDRWYISKVIYRGG